MYVTKIHSYSYGLILVDLFSQYVMVEPMKNKKAEEVKRLLDKMISENKLTKITTIGSDAAQEFIHNIPYYRKKGIKWFLLKSAVKGSFVELNIRIFKSYLYKLLRLNPGTPWPRLCQPVVDQMNKRSLKKLNGKSPNDLFLPISDVRSKNIFVKTDGQSDPPPGPTFKKDDLVFLDIKKHVNDKIYDTQRGAIKRVARVDKSVTPYFYILKHLDSEKELPRPYYGNELRLAPKLRAIPKQIDRIYDSRRKNKRKEFLVSFYGSDYKSWIPERILYKF